MRWKWLHKARRRDGKARRDLKSGAAMMRKVMDPGKATKGTVKGEPKLSS